MMYKLVIYNIQINRPPLRKSACKYLIFTFEEKRSILEKYFKRKKKKNALNYLSILLTVQILTLNN